LRTLQSLAHRASERHARTELLGDALRDKLSLSLRVLHLEDVELNLLAGELLEVGADALRLGAAATDDDAGARGVNVNANPVAGALNLDAGHAGTVERVGEHAADAHILSNVVAVALAGLGAVGEPPRHVVGGDTQTEPVRIYFLSHNYFPAFLAARATSASVGVASTTVMWLVRLRIFEARPCARGRKRLSVVPSSTNAFATNRSSSLR